MENHFDHIENDLRSLLNSKAVTSPTKKALEERVEKSNKTNRFFSNYSFNLLTIVCDLLMDQDQETRIVNVAVFIDERLSDKTCDGWRYNSMPPDDVMYKMGLEGIDETSSEMFGNNFVALEKEQRIKVLKAIQGGSPTGNTWAALPPKLFFEELLAETTEIFFSYPLVQMEMEYKGMADAAGWKKIGLNENDHMQKERI